MKKRMQFNLHDKMQWKRQASVELTTLCSDETTTRSLITWSMNDSNSDSQFVHTNEQSSLLLLLSNLSNNNDDDDDNVSDKDDVKARSKKKKLLSTKHYYSNVNVSGRRTHKFRYLNDNCKLTLLLLYIVLGYILTSCDSLGASSSTTIKAAIKNSDNKTYNNENPNIIFFRNSEHEYFSKRYYFTNANTNRNKISQLDKNLLAHSDKLTTLKNHKKASESILNQPQRISLRKKNNSEIYQHYYHHRNPLETADRQLLGQQQQQEQYYQSQVNGENSKTNRNKSKSEIIIIPKVKGIKRSIMFSEKDEFLYGQFPPDFLFGVATSSYQVEGGWNADGKGENTWDVFCHQTPSPIKDKRNGDIACDSYHKYKEDVQLVKKLNAKVYRISISWARILPKGTTEKVNQAGIDYYNNVINECLDNGIEPMLTLFHWDLPQNLQEMGGFQNEEIIGIFADYARICYQNFGDRVKKWITINEPYIYCMAGYDWGIFPPAVKDAAVSPFVCVHTMIKTHAMAYHIYKEEFAAKQKGKIGISVDSWWYEPEDSNKPEDVEAAERALQFRMGWIAGPLFTGDYPKVMKELIDRHSKLENRSESRLPYFSPEWSTRIKGSIDFLGLNHYTTELVKPAPPEKERPSWSSDSETLRFHSPLWPSTGSPWLKVVPFGLRKLLNWIHTTYNSPEIFITENGTSDTGGLNDTQRSEYFRLYINEVLKAVKLDGVNVSGYLAWSLMDVFEWDVGYTQKFGIYSVDFSDPDRKRTPKDSVSTLLKIFTENGFPKPKHNLLSSNQSETEKRQQSLLAGTEEDLNSAKGSASKFPFCTLTVLGFLCFFIALSITFTIFTIF